MAECGQSVSTIELINQAELVRTYMEDLAAQYGLADPRVLQCSQELDKPLLELQRRAQIVDIKRLPAERGKMVACDECGKMYLPQAIQEIKVARVPYYLYLCPGCSGTLARKLGNTAKAAG